VNPLLLLGAGKWLLYGALAAGVLLGIWRLDVSRQAIGYSKAQAEYAAAALKASEAARAKEQELQTKVTKVANDYQAEKRRRAADAVLNADRLRDLQAALADNSSNTPATSGTDDPRDAIINQCASSLVILDGDFKSLAAKASSMQSYASNVCVSQ
jgi:hypothetical protein